MLIPNGAPFTDHLVAGQKAWWCWIGSLRPVWIVKVTAKIVKVVEIKERFWEESSPERTFEEACARHAWSLDLDKVRNDLWLTENDYKAYCLDNKRKAIADLIIKLGKLTTERDALAAELGVEP
jgi:hypothetical protein